MATTRVAHTNWSGGLTDGSGTVFFDSSGIGSYSVSWPARSEQPGGKTSPEELIAAALSSCYSMALSHELGQRNLVATTIDTQARVTFEPGEGITGIQLSVRTSLTAAAPANSTPHEVAAPANSTPHDIAAPANSTPHDIAAPANSTPHEVAAPANSTPHDIAAPANSTPHNSTPHGTPAPLTAEEFQLLAERVKENCPVSQALAGVKITLDAALLTA